jgi:acetyl esterase
MIFVPLLNVLHGILFYYVCPLEFESFPLSITPHLRETCIFRDADPDPPDSLLAPEVKAWLSGPWRKDAGFLEKGIAGNLSAIRRFRREGLDPTDNGADTFYDGPNGKFMIKTYGAIGDLSPILFYIHGGGWIAGSVKKGMGSLLSMRLDLEVVAIEYSLSPKAKPGTSLKEIEIVWRNIDRRRLRIVCGDSSGGNLAAAFANMIEDKPDAVILMYPVVDISGKEYPSYHRFAQGYGLRWNDMKDYIKAYVPNMTERSLPMYSVINGDLRGFPDALVVVCQFDVLRDEGRAFAEKLCHSGRYVRFRCLVGSIHGLRKERDPRGLEIFLKEMASFLERFGYRIG